MPPRPSPHDVLAALKDFDPEAYAAAISDSRKASHVYVRRAAMAASRALGSSFPKIGNAFKRDHSTVVSACQRYCEIQHHNRRESEVEARLFRVLISKANERAARRAEKRWAI